MEGELWSVAAGNEKYASGRNWSHVLTFDSAAKPQFFRGLRSRKARFKKRLSRIDSESVQWGGEGDLIPPIFGVWGFAAESKVKT